MEMARGSSCSLYPGATTCKQGGDVVTAWPQPSGNVYVEFCHRAHLPGVRVESGSTITPDLSRTQPADVLVLDWERGNTSTGWAA